MDVYVYVVVLNICKMWFCIYFELNVSIARTFNKKKRIATRYHSLTTM